MSDSDQQDSNVTDISALRGWYGPENKNSELPDESTVFTAESSETLARNIVNLLENPNELRNFIEAQGLVSSRLVGMRGSRRIEGVAFQNLQKTSLVGKSFMKGLIGALSLSQRYRAVFPGSPAIDEYDFVNMAITLLVVDNENSQVVMEVRASYDENEDLAVPMIAIDPKDVPWGDEVYEIDIHGSFPRRSFSIIKGKE